MAKALGARVARRMGHVWVAGTLLVALGCNEEAPPVGVMELQSESVEQIQIESVTAWRVEIPGASATHEVYVEARASDQTPRGLWVTLQQPAWGASDVLYCEGVSAAGDPFCERFPVDADGDGLTDHHIERHAADDGSETISVWARFADDGEGPSEARATFRFHPDEAELLPLVFVEE